MAMMLLIVPGLVFLASPSADRAFNLFPYVFSKWGAGILLATAVFGFIAGSERTANLFALVWGTHPVWSRVGSWLEGHDTAAAALGWLLVASVVSFCWYLFRY
jgi:hypothetical protein